MTNPLQSAHYLLAAHLPRQLPADDGREVAFAGRSNAGKSSALNALCGQNSLARTSKTPGRTQQLVYFEVAERRYLVDLPGYGYAKVPGELRAHWQEFINGYFRNRQALVGLVVVMDIRHPLREFDLKMLDYTADRALPTHCLLTKADKFGRGQQLRACAEVEAALRQRYRHRVGVQVFSAPGRIGLDSARAVIAGWLFDPPAAPTPSDHA